MDQNAQQEHRKPPTDMEMMKQAKQNPGGWLYDIDWRYPETQRTPPEAIRGCWAIDEHGRITDHYQSNERYRAIQTSERMLKPYMHAGAKHTPDQWIVDIDPRGESLFPKIPDELIRGWWYVSKDGLITDLFRPNSRWRGEEHGQAPPAA